MSKFPRKEADGRWYHCFRVGSGYSNPIRRHFKTKTEALEYERECILKHERGTKPRSDKRRLSQLCELWYQLHGATLKDGENRLKVLKYLCERLGDPIASKFTTKDFTHYRAKRLTDHFGKAVSENTVNHETAYLRAVYNELIRLGEWQLKNPIKNVRMIKFDEKEMGWLNKEEIKLLLTDLKSNSTNDSTYLVARICLETGARWSEAELLTGDKIKKTKTGQYLTFGNTKSGKVPNIPINQELYELLKTRAKAYRRGYLFTSCSNAFRKSIERTKIELPKGEMTHVLRHTFGAHFMMNNGNILTLQKLLGHAKIETTMTYAHFSPEHLQDALTHNPLA